MRQIFLQYHKALYQNSPCKVVTLWITDSITIKGNKADCDFAIVVTGTFMWNELPKAIQDLLVKSGYKAEERIWLIERKNSYTQKGDIPFIDISHVIEGIVLPKSESQDPKILDFLDRYKDKIVSGTWKILWYQD